MSLEQAQNAQEQVYRLRGMGTDTNAPAMRQAVNRLMAHLRKLSPEERAAFDAWKAALLGGEEGGER